MIHAVKKLNHRIYPKKLFYGIKWVVLGVNNICNLHCKMCDVGLKVNDTNFAVNLTGTKPINMPLELVKRVIDQTDSYYPKAKLGYAFTEPLIYPHLIESLQYANEKNLFTTITTNALNLEHKAADLVQAGLNEIYISLDGPEEIHNSIRGHKSSYSRAISGIEALLETKNPPGISIFCVITEWNIGHLKRFVEDVRHLPLKEVGFMHTNFTTKAMAETHNQLLLGEYPATVSNMDEIDFSKMDLEVLHQEIEEITHTDYPFETTFSPEIHSRAQLDKFYNRPDISFGRRCNDVFNNLMIKSDGSVIPAHGRCYNLTIGNVYDESLKDIWNSKVVANFRVTLNKHGGLLPACLRCCSAFSS